MFSTPGDQMIEGWHFRIGMLVAMMALGGWTDYLPGHSRSIVHLFLGRTIVTPVTTE